MKAKLILAIGLCIAAMTSFAIADVETNKKASEESDHNHEDEGGHSDSHEEANPSVGTDKGITEADEHDGIKLSSEAIKNFELKTQVLAGMAPWEIPNSAILTAGEEVNIYRLRNGFYKRIDFNLISKNGSSLKINSKDLAKGDAVVIAGVGFLRTAEIAAFGGAPEGHSH